MIVTFESTYYNFFFGVHGAISCGQKKLCVSAAVLLSGFLSKGHLPRVSRQSPLSANDKVIMRCYRGLCTDLLALALQLKKILARRPSMKAVRSVIASNGGLYPQKMSVESHSTPGMEKEGKKERTYGYKSID